MVLLKLLMVVCEESANPAKILDNTSTSYSKKRIYILEINFTMVEML